MEDEDGSLVGGQMAEGPLQLVPIGYETGLVADGLGRDRRELDLDRPAPTPANGIEAGIDGQAMDPGVEAVGIAQAGQIAPRPDAGVLDRILREFLVPEDEASDRFEMGDGRADDQGEGIMIASACSFDEIPLVHGHPRARPNRPRFKGTGVAQCRIIPVELPWSDGGARGTLAPPVRLVDADFDLRFRTDSCRGPARRCGAPRRPVPARPRLL